MPVRVQAALALTEMILVHESGMFCFAICRHRRFGDERYLVKTAVSPQVGKVVQGEWFYFFFCWRQLVTMGLLDLLKLSDDTDLDILNHSMEVMVECFQNELLPVAGQLTARLVRLHCWLYFNVPIFFNLHHSASHTCVWRRRALLKKNQLICKILMWSRCYPIRMMIRPMLLWGWQRPLGRWVLFYSLLFCVENMGHRSYLP